MNSRYSNTPSRAQTALIHRGPQAMSAAHVSAPIHAPNAALLIDFDNVTMGIRSDLGKELRSLLSSEIIKGKVAVQRAYADWRRYPQYIVPLTEASIDLIFAPAYGASKKNATDIRLAIDAIELVFARPEIGTFILLSGDSDFSTLVIKLKEYGKYVIGVGIRESSSDLLVMNCDEYYSYNALAGLVKASEEETTARKYDPWELVTEAVQRMKRNNDVMRSDRLKQVMQEIDSTFDEKNLGISKFSRFCQEAAQKGLLVVTKLENGQLEVDLPGTPAPTEQPAARAERVVAESLEAVSTPSEERGSKRGRRGRGRGREREGREPREVREPVSARRVDEPVEELVTQELPVSVQVERAPEPERAIVQRAPVEAGIGSAGERLTRIEAFDLVRRTVDDLAPGDESVRASEIRRRARQLLGHDSESLSDRMFVRILKDAHDAGIVDLRRRGDDFEVARAVEASSVSEQVAERERAAVAAAAPKTPAAAPQRIGMGPRGAGARGRLTSPPPDLLAFGVVETAGAPAAPAHAQHAASPNGGPPAEPARKKGKRGRGKTAKQPAAAGTAAPPETTGEAATKAKRARGGAKKTSRPRAKKTTTASHES